MKAALRPLARVLSGSSFTAPRRRESWRVRARSAVLTGLLLLVAAQLGLGLAVETVKPEWRDPEYGHRIKQLRAIHSANPDRPLVVAVGSSRTLMGFSPHDTFLDRPGSPIAYNFGQTGAGPLQIRLTVERILADGVRPDFLLIELFAAALVGDGPAEGLIEQWGSRWNAGDVRRLAPYANDSSRLWRTWANHRIAPWHALRFPLMNHWQPGWLPTSKRVDFQWANMDGFGWLRYPVDSVPDDERERLTAAAGDSYRKQLTDYRIGAMSDRALRDVANRCLQEGIPVAFFLMPEGPAFASWYSPGAKERFRDYAQKLSRDTGAPIFDASEGFSERDFADSHHLLPGGAARFTRKLAAEHLDTWCRRQP
jgi:hypothetical protein